MTTLGKPASAYCTIAPHGPPALLAVVAADQQDQGLQGLQMPMDRGLVVLLEPAGHGLGEPGAFVRCEQVPDGDEEGDRDPIEFHATTR